MFRDKTDVTLISLVKQNPVLYDYNNPKYMDFNAREVTWQKIGDELKRPGESLALIGFCFVATIWHFTGDFSIDLIKKNCDFFCFKVNKIYQKY